MEYIDARLLEDFEGYKRQWRKGDESLRHAKRHYSEEQIGRILTLKRKHSYEAFKCPKRILSSALQKWAESARLMSSISTGLLAQHYAIMLETSHVSHLPGPTVMCHKLDVTRTSICQFNMAFKKKYQLI